MNPSPYIFVIGFNKTGTTSIHQLFEKNGFKSIHWDGGNLGKAMLLNSISGKPVFHGYDHKYNVFSDMLYRTENFWFEGNSLFRKMKEDYPHALFLYNYRSMEDWLKSRVNHNGIVCGLSFVDFYKKQLNTEAVDTICQYWARTRARFEEDLREYFHGDARFLELAIEDPEFPGKVSDFIGMELDPKHWGRTNATRKTRQR